MDACHTYNRIFLCVSPTFNLNSRDKIHRLWASVKMLGKESELSLSPHVTCNATVNPTRNNKIHGIHQC